MSKSRAQLTEGEITDLLMENCAVCGLSRVVFDEVNSQTAYEHECPGVKRYGLSRYPGEHKIISAPHDGEYVLFESYQRRIAELEASPWVNVSERLPTEEECKLTDGWSKPFVVRRSSLNLWYKALYSPSSNCWICAAAIDEGGSPLLYDVTHWLDVYPIPPLSEEQT